MLQRIQNIPLGLRFMLLSSMGFALMGATVKTVSQYGIPLMEIVIARALVSLIISYADVRRKRIPVWGHNKLLLSARGIVGAAALVCVYYSVTTLPLAEATILQYMHPVFTALLAFLLLGERVQFSTMVCIVLSITGLVVMVKPDLFFAAEIDLPLFSIMMALLGAFGSAVAYVIVRRLSQTEDSSVIILYFPLIALPAAILLSGGELVAPDGYALMLLILVGVFTQVGQVGLTKAMQHEAASKATAFSYIQVVFSILLGWFIFSELPSLWTLIGGGLIVSGALVNVLWKR
ncbi:DMT family transporter [Amphritea pacifica]|uniref:DMT family transporter n=1 Tax=Amphritea pacifica TaxID=2811233 RepID=UPI0019653D89|nr:DMT family transporter [Amphritea pacifica]MBN1008250.1 DMT family transporter [Amphritea pacifica]